MISQISRPFRRDFRTAIALFGAIVLAIVIAAFFPPPARAQYQGWTAFNTADEPNAYGVNITVMIPPGFELATGENPMASDTSFVFVRNEFDKGRGMYIWISASPLYMAQPEFPDSSVLKDRQGKWIDAKVERYLHSVARQITGYEKSHFHYYKKFPSVYMNARTNTLHGLTEVWAEQELRMVVYNDNFVMIGCNYTSTESDTYVTTAMMVKICRPFLHSLSFGR
jgi:hypothetical protein